MTIACRHKMSIAREKRPRSFQFTCYNGINICQQHWQRTQHKAKPKALPVPYEEHTHSDKLYISTCTPAASP